MQWYIQVRQDANLSSVEELIGTKLLHYVPNMAYIVLATEAAARRVLTHAGVLWVGKREQTHKVSKQLEGKRSLLQQDPLSALDSSEVAGSDVSLIVHLVAKAARSSLDRRADGIDDVLNEEELIASLEERFLLDMLAVDIAQASQDRLRIRVDDYDQLDAVVQVLQSRAEVLFVEPKLKYFPHNSAGIQMLYDGTRTGSRDNSLYQRGLNGSGQLVGIADTGIDWDNCFYWEPDNSKLNPESGKAPPFNKVDMSRRKIVSYNYIQDCAVCDVCPKDIALDRVDFVAPGGVLQSGGSRVTNFPAVESQSRFAPRLYDAIGASIEYNVIGITNNYPSEYSAPGSGALDAQGQLQVFVLRRKDGPTFSTANPDFSKCLNQCDLISQNPTSPAGGLLLPPSVGGYVVIIVNRGVAGGQQGINLLLRGHLQMKTPQKPCGDDGDDRAGHGTHVTGTVAGLAFAPMSHVQEVVQASEFNGMAPAARIYFSDLMQNADPNCNLASQTCIKVNDVTVPLDIYSNLLQPAWDAGVRVHLDSWGCKVPQGQNHSYCAVYNAPAMDIDKFMWDNPEFLVVTAVGDGGELWTYETVASPATCKNCISVGATYNFNEEYRVATTYRDPIADICPCTYPRECSQSDFISDVYVTSANYQTLMQSIPSCCNDTIQVEYPLDGIEIPANEMWTLHVPNMSIFDPNVQQYVKDNFQWATRGSSIEYEVEATPAPYATPNAGLETTKVQVMLFPRLDFFEYFESGVPTDSRPNPCMTSKEKQTSDYKTGIAKEPCLSRPSSQEVSQYVYLPGCEQVSYGGGPILQDVTCHEAECKRDPKPGDQLWYAGCALDDQGAPINCCNDEFLMSFCLNQPCNETASKLSRIVRHSTNLKKADSGYGIVIRNLALYKVILTGKITIRNVEYPCTLTTCCEAGAACCSTNYTRAFQVADFCSQCKFSDTAATCTPYESNEVPEWSGRGGLGQTGIGSGRFKPDVVGPGDLVITANSDGNTHSNTNTPLGVQCKSRSNIATATEGCQVIDADNYDVMAAVISASGTSISAAFVAGAVLLFRQYLAEGYYPSGFRSPGSAWSNPTASLLKAMVVNGASSVGGGVVVDKYQEPPTCADPENCPTWVQPPPVKMRVPLSSSPNAYEGFGRPRLVDSLWFADSSWSFWLKENVIEQAGYMHTYTFKLLAMTGQQPLRITLAYTDPPSSAGSTGLVNDLDLVVQRTAEVMEFNTTTGSYSPTFVFDLNYGNDAQQLGVKDFTSTVEKIELQSHPESTITIVVVAYSLNQYQGSLKQPYSLVVSGWLRPKYYEWMQGPIKEKMLQMVSAGTAAGWKQFDVFGVGYVLLRDLQILFPSTSDTQRSSMFAEADGDGNKKIDEAEFADIVVELQSGARRPAAPVFTSEPASATFLHQASNATSVMSESSRVNTSQCKGMSLMLLLLVACLSYRM